MLPLRRLAITAFASAIVAPIACGAETSQGPLSDAGVSSSGSSSGTGASSGSGINPSSGSSSGSVSGSSSGSSSGPSTSSGGTLPVVAGDAGLPCVAPAGEAPSSACDDGTESLCASQTTCNLSSCQATSVAAGSCEPLTTNPAGGPWDLRMRRLILVAPTNLATATVQNALVTNGVDLNEPQCGELGTGTFNWLLHLDPTAGTVTTGGAPPCDLPNPTATTPVPSCDPFTTGYCFLTSPIGPFLAQPVTAPLAKDAAGVYSATLGTLDLPVSFDGDAFVWPIRGAAFEGIRVTDSGNCIGSFNPNALDAQCDDSYESCSKWLTGGAVSGYITLEDADQVPVALLSKTLCAILTGQSGVSPPDGGSLASCARDSSGKILAKGDYCATTGAPGGCADAYWFAATFAASAAPIHGVNGGLGCAAGDGGP